MTTKKTVLITGCSAGGMGAALAQAFHKSGLHVIATARNPTKMAELAALGIETLTLDVLDEASIAAAVSKVPKLDMLINNAGSSYSMPISDIDIKVAKDIFDVNVWAYIAVTQAFLPLILASKGMIVNQTSVVGTAAVPFQAAYNASKAAAGLFSDTLRLELEPFGVTVIDLKTGAIASNMIKNQKELTPVSLPTTSIYLPAKEAVESAMKFEKMESAGTPPDVWAAEVVGDLLKKKPPAIIWRGAQAKAARLGTLFPHGMLDGTMKKLTGLDIVEQKVKK